MNSDHSGTSKNQNDPVVDSSDEREDGGYQRLINDFGIQPISDILSDLPQDQHHFLMKRDIMFGHIGLESILEAISSNQPFAVITGIKPSGFYHIGSLATVAELVYFQNLGGKLSFTIADIETYATSGQSITKSAEIAIDNIADLLAMGVSPNPEDTVIYRQSEDKTVLKYAQIFSNHISLNTLQAVYGEKVNIGYYNSAMVLVADILRPQIDMGAMPTITPVGADQVPHSMITRDIAQKQVFQEQFNFQLPSFTFHKMLGGLDGSKKMSKSNPLSYFSLGEPMKSITKKIDNALTGGKDTAEEQRKFGGQPQKCRVFDLFSFLFEDDNDRLQERELDCSNGDLLCGECKGDLKDEIQEFRNKHIEKKKQMIEISELLMYS